MTERQEGADGRERLLIEARRLFLERGYAEVSMQEIAAAAEMTKGAPYYHFRDKEDLFVQVFRREMASLTARVVERLAQAPTFRARLLVVLELAAGSAKTSFGRLVTEFDRHVSPERRQEVQRECAPPTAELLRVFEQARAEGELTRTDPTSAYAIFLALLIGQGELRKIEPGVAAVVGWNRVATPEQLVDAFLHGV